MIRSQRGLTMIEVLAAMVIFSAGAVILFGWIGQTAQRLARLNEEQSKLFSELAAIEYMRSLNPMRRPAGDEVIGEARFGWQAVPVGSEQAARTPGGTEGNYVLQLYQVRLWVDADNSGKSERSLWLTGWRQVRSGAPASSFQSLGAPSQGQGLPPGTLPPTAQPR